MNRKTITGLQLTPAEEKEAVVEWINSRPTFKDHISIEQVEVV